MFNQTNTNNTTNRTIGVNVYDPNNWSTTPYIENTNIINLPSSGETYLTDLKAFGNTANYLLQQTITHSNNMDKQVKVAVFTVERNDKNEVISSKFVKELWVEIKKGVSLELTVAKQLDKDFDPETIVIKEITTITF
jgi:hypothetical protein